MPNYIFDDAGTPYDLPPSLADQKSLSLAGKYAEKKENITPAPVQVGPSPAEVAAARARIAAGPTGAGQGAGLLDMAEASLYRGAGNVAGTYENIRQNLFGDEDYSLSPEVKAMQDKKVADAMAGFTGSTGR